MKAFLCRTYAVVAYLAFALSFVALVLASTGLLPAFVPAVDGAPRLGPTAALGVDLALVLAFAVQHTVMARPKFKLLLTRIVPHEVERSTFVLASAVLTAAIAYAWAPVGGDVWRVEGSAALALHGVALAGFALTFVASWAFDHFALFGLRLGKAPAFATPPLYRIVRHPMMLGVLIGVWAAPHMTVGHVVFAVTMTGYVIVGVHFEERSLLRELGERYARYCEEVPMLLPWPRPRARRRPSSRPGIERFGGDSVGE